MTPAFAHTRTTLPRCPHSRGLGGGGLGTLAASPCSPPPHWDGTGRARYPAQSSAVRGARSEDVPAHGAARAPAPSASCSRGVGRWPDPRGRLRFTPLFLFSFSPFFPPFPFRCFVSLFACGASLRQVPPFCRAPSRRPPPLPSGAAGGGGRGRPRNLRARAELRPAGCESREGNRLSHRETPRCWKAERGAGWGWGGGEAIGLFLLLF